MFGAAADAQAAALAPLQGRARRGRTDVAGQYALDLVADAAVLDVLAPSGVAVVSEESGRTGPRDAAITVVVDPVDGSTNCSRSIPYWAISLCALDADGPLAALVANQATGERFTAARGHGARVDGESVIPATTERLADSLLAVSGLPERHLGWKQFRSLGSVALTLCDLAAGRVDAYLDVLDDQHAPWDYLGGLLVCTEAGLPVVDRAGRGLVTDDPAARRTLLGASTPVLLDELTAAVTA
ncbi:MAG TPA: inositol monophosphatase [Acidimicrobiia bacterium]|nr:inositol monophosphatase [Acidimicrobiia bacterium]